VDIHARNTQLPSPISPMTQLSPTPTPYISSHSLHSPKLPSTRSSNNQTPRCDIVPMKGFFHEVLRRSRTSGSVLQTALGFLEAIRAKVPELITQEKEQLGCTCEKTSSQRTVNLSCEVNCTIEILYIMIHFIIVSPIITVPHIWAIIRDALSAINISRRLRMTQREAHPLRWL